MTNARRQREIEAKPFGCPICARLFATEGALNNHTRGVHAGRAPAPPLCAECGLPARLVGGTVIYPHRADLHHKSFWLCSCGAYCGCHAGTIRTLGTPCGALTRRARTNAHSYFDPIWAGGSMARKDAYFWLAKSMGIPFADCHIGSMTAQQAHEVVRLCMARAAA